MSGHYRKARQWALSLIAVLAVLTPLGLLNGHPAEAAQTAGCSTAAEVRATTCRLLDGQTVEASLSQSDSSSTYRVDALGPDATLDLVVSGSGDGTQISVLDWRGTVLGEAAMDADAAETRLSARLPQPGSYGIRISSGDVPADSLTYRLTATLAYAEPPGRAVWPTSLADGDGPLNGERQIVRTPRGGTPAGGLAIARALGAPPDGEVGDFTLVADVQFERIVGPSAFTVRFRYEPEAGGGTGYVFSLNPFSGTASLESFDEGQRRSIVSQAPLPFMATSEGPNRLVVRAEGPAILVTLDGQTVIDVADSRYPRGLIAVGVVTWSDPVAVLFDHIQVTTPH